MSEDIHGVTVRGSPVSIISISSSFDLDRFLKNYQGLA